MRLLLAPSLAIALAALFYPFFLGSSFFDTGMDPATHVSISGNLLAGAVRGRTLQIQESRTLVTDRPAICCVLAVRILHDRLEMCPRYKSLPLKGQPWVRE